MKKHLHFLTEKIRHVGNDTAPRLLREKLGLGPRLAQKIAGSAFFAAGMTAFMGGVFLMLGGGLTLAMGGGITTAAVAAIVAGKLALGASAYIAGRGLLRAAGDAFGIGRPRKTRPLSAAPALPSSFGMMGLRDDFMDAVLPTIQPQKNLNPKDLNPKVRAAD